MAGPCLLWDVYPVKQVFTVKTESFISLLVFSFVSVMNLSGTDSDQITLYWRYIRSCNTLNPNILLYCFCYGELSFDRLTVNFCSLYHSATAWTYKYVRTGLDKTLMWRYQYHAGEHTPKGCVLYSHCDACMRQMSFYTLFLYTGHQPFASVFIHLVF